MPGKIIVKREWDSSLIKVVIDEGGVMIEASVDAFQRRIEEHLLTILPSLSWSFKSSTINETVRKAFRDAFNDVVMEMKEETVKVINAKI